MVGVPVIINHKNLSKDNADDERVGVVNSVWYDDKDGWYWCDGIIWNETAQNLVTDKKWSVSCSYDVKTADDRGGSENNIKYEMEFLDGTFTHLALVDNPRYERANIVFNSKTVIENGNPNKYPAGAPDGKGGQFAPTDGRSFKNYTLDILKRANLMAGVRHFEVSKSGYAVRFTIPSENFEAREGALARMLNKDKKVHHYAFGNTSDGQTQITIQFANGHIDNEKEQDVMILDKLKQFVAQIENEKDDQDGRWITVKGTHVFIKKGQSVEEALKQKNLGDLKEAYDLRGKYEREDVDFDEEQLKKDIDKAKDLGFETVEDIAEFLGLDEDEVRETLASSTSKKEGDFKFKTDDEYKSKKHPDGIVFDLIGEDELIKGFEDASKGQAISKELEDKLSKEMQKYSNLPGWSDKFEQMWDEIDDYRDQWKNNKNVNNNKEHDMALLEELKKLITKVENNKGEDDMEINNDKVDKRKLIDEVAGIMKSAGCDDELIRTAIGKMEKMSYDKSEAGTADNEKEDDKKDDKAENCGKKVKNEDEKDEKEVKEVKEEVKEDVENKCKNSVDNSKGLDFFEKMNSIYNSAKKIDDKVDGYESRQSRLDAGAEYFG